MDTKTQINLRKAKYLLEDYKFLMPERNNSKGLTYYQFTVANRAKLDGMLKSGHRLCTNSNKTLKLYKKSTDEGYFRYMNPHSLPRLVEATLRAVEAYGIKRDRMHLVTIIEEKWFTTLENFELNLIAIRSKICQEMRGLHALFMVEAAFLENGVISMHCQGIAWDLTAENIAFLKTRFRGMKDVAGFDKGFEAIEPYDPVGAVSYMFKPPTYGYQKPLYPRGHKTKRLRNRDCYELFKAVGKLRKPKKLTYFDFMIGVGQGVQMKADIMEFLSA